MRREIATIKLGYLPTRRGFFSREDAQKYKKLVEEKMRSALELDVPVKVNIGVGKNWLEAGE